MSKGASQRALENIAGDATAARGAVGKPELAAFLAKIGISAEDLEEKDESDDEEE